MKIVLAVLLSLCLAVGVAFGGAANMVTGEGVTTETKIPNYVQQDEEGNGRPQHMNIVRPDGEELNPVERRIIVRDTVISNRQNLQNRAGE